MGFCILSLYIRILFANLLPSKKLVAYGQKAYSWMKSSIQHFRQLALSHYLTRRSYFVLACITGCWLIVVIYARPLFPNVNVKNKHGKGGGQGGVVLWMFLTSYLSLFVFMLSIIHYRPYRLTPFFSKQCQGKYLRMAIFKPLLKVKIMRHFISFKLQNLGNQIVFFLFLFRC